MSIETMFVYLGVVSYFLLVAGSITGMAGFTQGGLIIFGALATMYLLLRWLE